MGLVNRKLLARRVSDKTGYFQQDIEAILEKEEEAIEEFIKENYNKIKVGKLYQIDVLDKESKQAWDGIRKKYYQLPPRKQIKIKPLTKLKELVDKINKELDNKEEK